MFFWKTELPKPMHRRCSTVLAVLPAGRHITGGTKDSGPGHTRLKSSRVAVQHCQMPFTVTKTYDSRGYNAQLRTCESRSFSRFFFTIHVVHAWVSDVFLRFPLWTTNNGYPRSRYLVSLP